MVGASNLVRCVVQERTALYPKDFSDVPLITFPVAGEQRAFWRALFRTRGRDWSDAKRDEPITTAILRVNFGRQDKMSRDNAQWVEDLRGDEVMQAPALIDLRNELLRRLRNGLAHYPRADEAFLEDAVQDSVIRILDRIEQFEGRSSFLTWATTIAIRTAISSLRRRNWKDVSLNQFVGGFGTIADLSGESALDASQYPDQMTIVEQLYCLIDNALTSRQRKALLAELKGMPQDEIAQQLGTNRNALYKLTHDARKKLKTELEVAGYSADDLLKTTLH